MEAIARQAAGLLKRSSLSAPEGRPTMIGGGGATVKDDPMYGPDTVGSPRSIYWAALL
jgi:hypothetical protein